MLIAQRSTLRLFGRLKASIAQVRQSVQTWIRQEIVDDDPWDVETFFPEAQPEKTPVYGSDTRSRQDF